MAKLGRFSRFAIEVNGRHRLEGQLHLSEVLLPVFTSVLLSQHQNCLQVTKKHRDHRFITT